LEISIFRIKNKQQLFKDFHKEKRKVRIIG